MATVKKYTDIIADLQARGNAIKSASTKKADGVPSVPETDPADKGTASTPRDPNATPAVQNMPAGGANTDATPVYTAPPAKVIAEPEKAASALTTKAARLLTTVQNLRKSAAGTASAISTNGSLPNDAGNDNKSKQTLDAPKPAPAAGKADPAVKESGADAGPKDKAQTSTSMPTGDSKGEMPKETTNTNDAKAASEIDPDLANLAGDHTFFAKLAQTCLQFEEGRTMMEACLKKAHGAEHATNLIKTAMFMEQRQQELEAMEEAGVSAAEQFWKSASDEDKAGLIKLASTHETALASLATPLEREAYLEGAKIAADMADAGLAGEQPPAGVPGMGAPDDPAAAGAGAAPGGDPTGGAGGAPADGASGGEVSDEDIIQALQMLVQEGKVSEEEAEAILQQLLGGQGGAGGPQGAAPDAAGGAAPDAGADSAEPTSEEKGAAAQLKTVGQAVDSVLASLAPKA